MEMKEFAGKVCSELEKQLGSGYELRVQEVRKNNGVMLHGLMAMRQGQGVAPTIYLDTFLKAYESGTAFGPIVQRLLEICCEEGLKGPMDMGFFQSFEAVRDRICYRLIGREGNGELLEEIPHMGFLDLAVCFYYAYHGDSHGDGTITIYNSHMELWGTSTEELFELAKRNTARLFGWECSSLGEILEEMADGEDGGADDMDGSCLEEVPLKVLSNKKRCYGAICMLYPDVLESVAREEQRDLYILPSSVHEVILLPDTGAGDAGKLKDMIAEVNRTQVAPEEVLSYSLYLYDWREKRIKIVWT